MNGYIVLYILMYYSFFNYGTTVQCMHSYLIRVYEEKKVDARELSDLNSASCEVVIE